MTEKVNTVHQSFHAAQAFVRQYLEHVERMLRDSVSHFETHSWRMLRYNGERCVGNLDNTLDAKAWYADWLMVFYAPNAAFRGTNYGVAAASVPHVAFVGVGLMVEETPELWVGWIEGHDTNGSLEPRLRSFFELIDPPELSGVPAVVTRLEHLNWATVIPNNNHASIRVALERVPLSLIGSASDLERVIDSLAAALAVRTSK